MRVTICLRGSCILIAGAALFTSPNCPPPEQKAMKIKMSSRSAISFILAISLLSLPNTAFGKKGDKNFKRGMQYESAQQWDKAAQEFTLAVAADPSNMEYQLHFRRASFNASQSYMQQGRALSERGDFVGAYNAFRQAYGYDPVSYTHLRAHETGRNLVCRLL